MVERTKYWVKRSELPSFEIYLIKLLSPGKRIPLPCVSRVLVKHEGWEDKTEGLVYLTPPLLSWPRIENNPYGMFVYS